ncbi:uncharacterized protein UTRI_06287 [Ustilago trichophora]|uniref:Uncharacterized protein n=1 Tax=Ustilago trichophora TaxID=86804 RepID=A0A5C3EFQ5_9BASI|nr:uncharacterized protein UTRI_06287 [Ustilago trichophora]
MSLSAGQKSSRAATISASDHCCSCQIDDVARQCILVRCKSQVVTGFLRGLFDPETDLEMRDLYAGYTLDLFGTLANKLKCDHQHDVSQCSRSDIHTSTLLSQMLAVHLPTYDAQRLKSTAELQKYLNSIDEQLDYLKTHLQSQQPDFVQLCFDLLHLALTQHDRLVQTPPTPPAQAADYVGDKVRSDFALPFFGHLDSVLQANIVNANNYIDQHPNLVYSKSFPILQSSGTGKSKLAVQLSASHPGFLVCTRSPGTELQVSFPPNDKSVYDFLSKQYASSLQAHKRVACWLAAYFDVLATALTHRMRDSNCFKHVDSQRYHPTVKRGHDVNLCWQTVVFQLALAIHDGPDFIQNYSFDQVAPLGAKCPKSQLGFESPTSADKSLERTDDRLNWKQIDDGPVQPEPAAASTSTSALTSGSPARPLTEQAIAMHYARRYMQTPLRRLERLLPDKLLKTHFFFLAIDEILPIAHTLPILRRLWREAQPASTWLMLIDTDSQVAPLAGIQVRKASARLDTQDDLLVIPPFVKLGFDAVIKHRIESCRGDFYQGRLTFGQLLEMLSCFGRPLWSTNLYRSVDEPTRPNIKNILAKLLADQHFPDAWPRATEHDLRNADSIPFKALMAIVEQRLPLHFVGHQGARVVPRPQIDSNTNFAIRSASKKQSAPVADDSSELDLETRSTLFLQEQASKHLRVISKVHDNVNFFVTCTVSEPALSLAVASLLRGNSTSSSTLIKCYAMHVGLMLGEEGEEGFRLLCTLAADLVAEERAKKEQMHKSTGATRPGAKGEASAQAFSAKCDPIPLQSWLDKLFGKVNLEPELRAWASNYYINFTHFLRLGAYIYSDELSNDAKRLDITALAEYWWRQAAINGRQNQPAWDIIIPIYRSVGPPALSDRFEPARVSYIAVQVKNKESDTSATRFFGPSFRQGESSKGLDPRLGFDNECLEIFVDLRSPTVLPHRFEWLAPNEKEKLQPPLTRLHLTVSGRSPDVFPLIRKLSSEAAERLPLLFGSTVPSLEESSSRRQLYKVLNTSSNSVAKSEFERLERILDGDGPAHLWDCSTSRARKRARTKIPWAAAAATEQQTAEDNDDSGHDDNDDEEDMS